MVCFDQGKKVNIVVLNMPILDTRLERDLMERFLCDVILHIQAFAAENDKNNIKVSQAEGIASAREKGVVFGRPRKSDIDGFRQRYEELKEQGLKNDEIAKEIGIGISTLYRYLRELNTKY